MFAFLTILGNGLCKKQHRKHLYTYYYHYHFFYFYFFRLNYRMWKETWLMELLFPGVSCCGTTSLWDDRDEKNDDHWENVDLSKSLTSAGFTPMHLLGVYWFFRSALNEEMWDIKSRWLEEVYPLWILPVSAVAVWYDKWWLKTVKYC